MKTEMPVSNRSTPIGVFWDIENCHVPFHKSALSLVAKIREQFFADHNEVEFMCVCDTNKENKTTLTELNYAQVTVVHINAVSKNTADDKLRQSMRRFAAEHPPPATIILITGDINFSSELSDLRFRHRFRTILLHKKDSSEALLSIVNERYCFEDFVEDVAERKISAPESMEEVRELLVEDLPLDSRAHHELKRLCDPLRGRIMNLDGGTARLRFPNQTSTLRAKRRMNGEQVCGSKITVSFPEIVTVKHRHRNVWNSAKSNRRKTEDRQVQDANSSSPQSPVASLDSTDLLDVNINTSDPMKSNLKHSGIAKKLFPDAYKSGSCDFGNDVIALESGVRGLDFGNPDIIIEGEIEINCDRDGTSMTTSQNCATDGSIQHVSSVDKKTKKNSNKKAKKKDHLQNSTNKLKKSGPVKTTRLNTNDLNNLNGIQLKLNNTGPDIGHQHSSGGSSAMTVLVQKCTKPSIGASNNINTMDAGNKIYTNWNNQGRSNEVFSSKSYVGSDLVGQQHKPCDRQPRRSFDATSHCSVQLGNHFGINGTSEQGNFGNGDSHTSSGMASAMNLWRCTPPAGVVLDASNFRRTPGARRPTSMDTLNGSRLNCPTLHPKPLFPSMSCMAMDNLAFNGIRESNNKGLGMSTGVAGHSVEAMSYNEEEVPMVKQPGIELVVSNLDYNISTHEWKKILMAEFQQHIQILSINVQMQADNTSVGLIRVPTIEDAKYAVSQFHRKKIGYKRIHVALVSPAESSANNSLKSEVATLLKELPGQRLPLFQFIEFFEKKFHRRISVSELYHMKDVAEIVEQEGAGRIVLLAVEQTILSDSKSTEAGDEVDSPVCRIHCREVGHFYLDGMDMSNLPHVILQLRSFSTQVHKLLQTHEGSLPLVSFPVCYSQELEKLHAVPEGGVPLEHLIRCVPGVELTTSTSGIKKVHWAENRSISPINGEVISQPCLSPPLSQQLTQFGHEVVDLLKSNPQCRLPFSRFIPAYHHHFGRQCRVADYGFTKLLELFESIPHIAQVIGSGSKRYVTLTHRAQVKRFTVDLLRVLKQQTNRQVNLIDYPIVYNKVVGKLFDITEFGVCFLEDMLGELPESLITISGSSPDTMISLPKRDQTPEEMEKMRQFSIETIDLLKNSPQCRMPFSKFIPAYHHHFGKQCRVADYGFTKLIELFEAMPNIIKITDEQEEKILMLAEVELFRVLGEQITRLLQSSPNCRLAVPEFLGAYVKAHGHSLHLNDFGVSSVAGLIEKMSNIVKLESKDGRSFVTLIDRSRLDNLTRNVILLLMDCSEGCCLSFDELCRLYLQLFGEVLEKKSLTDDLQDVVQVIESSHVLVKLCPLQMFARDARTLLLKNNNHLPLNQFEATYQCHFGVALMPATYNYPNVVALLQAIPLVVFLRGKGCHRMIHLAQHFQVRLNQMSARKSASEFLPLSAAKALSKSASPATDSGYPDRRVDEELMSLHAVSSFASCDLLSDPVPSSVPSPELFPQVNRPPSSLIQFDSHASNQDLLMLSTEEKRGLMTPLCRTPVSELLAFAAQLLPSDMYRHPTFDRHLQSDQFRNPRMPILQLMNPSSDWSATSVVDSDLKLNAHGPIHRSISVDSALFNQTSSKSCSDLWSHYKSMMPDECREPDGSFYPPIPFAAPHVSEVQAQMTARNDNCCGIVPSTENRTGSVDGKASLPMSSDSSSECIQDQSLLNASISSNFGSTYGSGASGSGSRRNESVKRSRIAARFDLAPSHSSSSLSINTSDKSATN